MPGPPAGFFFSGGGWFTYHFLGGALKCAHNTHRHPAPGFRVKEPIPSIPENLLSPYL